MRLERPEGSARHRGVRPVFLLTLALALSLAVLVATRAGRHDDPPSYRMMSADIAASIAASTQVDWWSPGKAHCNAVEVTTYLAAHDPGPDAMGVAQRAACLAIAGKLDAARRAILTLPLQDRDLAVNQVFFAAHPVADAGDDASAGPIMELVIEFQPNQYMALYHAGMAAAIAGDDARARVHLTRFLQIYRAQDGWTQNARNALASLARPQAQRTVKQGGEGSVIY